MENDIKEQTRKELMNVLPDAIRKTLKSYRSFVGSEVTDTAKQFSAHHAACKTAITHLEILLKLARWAELNGHKQGKNDHLSRLLAEAEQELQAYEALQSQG